MTKRSAPKIRRLLENARGNVHGKKSAPLKKGGGHRGKLQREDYRQLDYQATTSLLALASERTSE